MVGMLPVLKSKDISERERWKKQMVYNVDSDHALWPRDSSDGPWPTLGSRSDDESRIDT